VTTVKLTGMLVAAGTALLLGTTPAEGAAPRAHGRGSGIFLAPPFTGDRVDVDLDASGSAGHFEIVHYDRSGKVFAKVSGTVECVAVNGRMAVTTGKITAGFSPAGDPRGKSFAITVLDNDGKPDALGVSFPLPQLPPCSAWPLNMVMDRGDYTIG
jgi:hypothetical protein